MKNVTENATENETQEAVPKGMSYKKLLNSFRMEDKEEINEIVDYIVHFSSRLDKYAFDEDMTKTLKAIIKDLKILKKQLVKKYYKAYGKPKVI